eukprot:11178529-Lingulodinium_polyedra.AAC.1
MVGNVVGMFNPIKRGELLVVAILIEAVGERSGVRFAIASNYAVVGCDELLQAIGQQFFPC